MEEKKTLEQSNMVLEKEMVEEVPQETNTKLLTSEILEKVLSQVLEHFKQQDKNMELAILQTIHVQNNTLVLHVSGHVQEELAQKMKPELISVIRQKTGVGKCQILIESRDDLEENVKVYYTDSDKLRRLKQLHPALEEFQKRFGLETDF